MTYQSTIRDRISHRVSNWLLNHVATPEYRAFVTVLIKLGREQLDEELGIGSDGLTDSEREALAKHYDAQTTPSIEEAKKVREWLNKKKDSRII